MDTAEALVFTADAAQRVGQLIEALDKGVGIRPATALTRSIKVLLVTGDSPTQQAAFHRRRTLGWGHLQ